MTGLVPMMSFREARALPNGMAGTGPGVTVRSHRKRRPKAFAHEHFIAPALAIGSKLSSFRPSTRMFR
jgi:hypothetical protein